MARATGRETAIYRKLRQQVADLKLGASRNGNGKGENGLLGPRTGMARFGESLPCSRGTMPIRVAGLSIERSGGRLGQD
jgi:hypothetical protein